MFTIHATAKLMTALKLKPEPARETTTRLGNWYATLVAGPRGRIICISDRTMLPVIIDRCKAPELPRALADGLARLLDDLEIPKPLIEQERFAMMQATWAKTVDASLNGVLNEQRVNASFLLEIYDPTLPVLNRYAAQNIVKSEFPSALTRAAFGVPESIRVEARRPDLSRLIPLELESVDDRGPQPMFEMERLFGGEGIDAIDASIEARDAGQYQVAKAMLEDLLEADVRFLDAHAHLGNLKFDHNTEEALQHFALGAAIGNLSLGKRFEGLLPWSCIGNRPYLRCVHGEGLCLWRLGRFKESKVVLERLLQLNPTDNQGARFVLEDLRHRRPWRDDL
jgi:tetratricopeptide (TPR) repeat protein